MHTNSISFLHAPSANYPSLGFFVPFILSVTASSKRVSSQLLQVLPGMAGTQPPISFTKKQTSNWGREGGSLNLNKLLLVQILPEYAKTEKNSLAALG